MQPLKLIECPRDAMQGWKAFIPTKEKVEYINQLLQVGFDTIDFGSFVSPRAIPQLADTAEVMNRLDMTQTDTKLLAIVGNLRGAEAASGFEGISYLGFPFSVSPTFQRRNLNSTIEASLETVSGIKEICDQTKKCPVIYISMAFGNPYEDLYSEDLVLEWIGKLVGEGIGIVSLADTVGVAAPSQVASLVRKVILAFPDIETGVHLHSTYFNWEQKIQAALENGCRRFDGALKGFGGCPMAEDELVGNMNTELMIAYFQQQGMLTGIRQDALLKASDLAAKIFI